MKKNWKCKFSQVENKTKPWNHGFNVLDSLKRFHGLVWFSSVQFKLLIITREFEKEIIYPFQISNYPKEHLRYFRKLCLDEYEEIMFTFECLITIKTINVFYNSIPRSKQIDDSLNTHDEAKVRTSIKTI